MKTLCWNKESHSNLDQETTCPKMTVRPKEKKPKTWIQLNGVQKWKGT